MTPRRTLAARILTTAHRIGCIPDHRVLRRMDRHGLAHHRPAQPNNPRKQATPEHEAKVAAAETVTPKDRSKRPQSAG